MNAPIEALYNTGSNLYAVLVSPADGKVWRFDTSVWEVYNSGHWASYAVPMTEYTGSGYYRATYPITTPTVLSSDLIFLRGGATATLGDSPVSSIIHSQGVNVGAAANSWTAGQNFGSAVGTEQTGAISGTPASGLLLPTNLTSTEDDCYAGAAIIMTSGDLIQQRSFITAYDGSTKILTINGFPSADTPADTDTFVIV